MTFAIKPVQPMFCLKKIQRGFIKPVSITMFVTFATLVSGCSTLSALNPFASQDKPRNPPTPLTIVPQSLAVRTAWSSTIGPVGAYTFTPAISGEALYAATRDGTVMRLNAADGRVIWRIKAGQALTAGVGSDGTTVVVAGTEGRIMAFDADGKPRWTAQASSEVLSAPAVGAGIVIVRSQDNRVVGLDVETGERKWAIQKTSPPLTLRAAPGILIKGPNAYIALAGGKLLSVVVATGVPRWEAAVGEARGATELERIIDTSGLPIAIERNICAVSYQGRAMCFDADNGTAVWAKDLSSEVGLGADERFVFASDTTGAVSASSGDTGAGIWKNTQLRYRGLTTPVALSAAVAVGDVQGIVHFLDRNDGALMSRIATDGSAIQAEPILAGRQLIVQTRAGSLVALALP